MRRFVLKCFDTPKNKYFYDRHTNSIVQVNQDDYRQLMHLEQSEEYNETDSINRLREQKLLKENVVDKICHPETENIIFLTNNCMSQLILQVTQQCNFRCKYCAYSGNYYNRKHSTQRMSLEIALKAIDFYLERSGQTEKLVVSFYGGEPLLEFDLIQECVTYILKRSRNKTVEFHMTTNGSLLSREIRDFIAIHNFYITISLDGDGDRHNVNRQFMNGTGTFECIMSNLEKLKNENYDYYIKFVGFNVVMNPDAEIEKVLKFYSEDSLVKNNRVRLNEISRIGVKNQNLIKFNDNFWTAWRYEYLKLLLYMLKKIDIENVNALMLQYEVVIQDLYRDLHRHDELFHETHHGGPCVPGVRRIMVTTMGDIYPCERISECVEIAKIGNIETGFDYKAIDKILNCGNLTEEECKNCWNLVQCSICMASIDPLNNMITKSAKLQKCIETKKNTLGLFRKLCVLVENGYGLPEEKI